MRDEEGNVKRRDVKSKMLHIFTLGAFESSFHCKLNLEEKQTFLRLFKVIFNGSLKVEMVEGTIGHARAAVVSFVVKFD